MGSLSRTSRERWSESLYAWHNPHWLGFRGQARFCGPFMDLGILRAGWCLLSSQTPLASSPSCFLADGTMRYLFNLFVRRRHQGDSKVGNTSSQETPRVSRRTHHGLNYSDGLFSKDKDHRRRPEGETASVFRRAQSSPSTTSRSSSRVATRPTNRKISSNRPSTVDRRWQEERGASRRSIKNH